MPIANLQIAAKASMTPAQLHQAEIQLDPSRAKTCLRTWVNTHVDQHSPLRDHQFLQIATHPEMAQDCPCVCAENCPPQIALPCLRREALWQQQAWVAHDELNFYMDIIAAQQIADAIPVAVFDTETVLTEGAKDWLHVIFHHVEHDQTCVTACLFERHWIPVLIRRNHTVIQFFTTPEGSILIPHAQALSTELAVTLQVVQHPLPQAFAADCGFQAFAWTFALALDQPIEAFPPDKAEGWRMIFAAHLLKHDLHDEMIQQLHLGGANGEGPLFEQLSQLLTEHGVWSDRVSERAHQVMAKINHATLRTALASPRPWPELKAAANHVSPVLKLIMPDELQAQIDARTHKKTKFGRKPAAKSWRKPDKQPEPPTVYASDLQIPHGVFAQQDGQVLGPVRPLDIGPSTRGVVLVDQQDSLPLRKMQMPVSQQGLALLVLATKANAAHHHIEPIRFPAMCVATQEPIIVSGYMYQLGALTVQRHAPVEKIAVDQIDTEAVRCLIFKDQAGHLWDAMQTQPVKTIFVQEPLLQHSQDTKSPVIDVWDRQWMTKRFEKTKPQSADLFGFTFRMEASKHDELLMTSGNNGVYNEPRSTCGRKPNDAYHVTWLPNMSFQEAKYAQQTSGIATTLTRHGDRYGLRSDAMNAQDVHQKYHPETPLLMGSKAMYTMGPLPFSTTKDGVAKLLKARGWDARPLQPKGRTPDSNGIQWTIQAVEDPSFWIYALQHGDVLITKQQPAKPASQIDQVAVIASRKTLEHLGNQAPWLQQDPWQQPSKQTVSHAPAAPPGLLNAQLATMEANLEKKLMSTLQTKPHDTDKPMEPSPLEARVTQLERQLSQVHMSQTGLENKVGSLQVQIDQQSHLFGQALDSKLAEQMDKIESFLIKRSRHE